MVGGTVRDLLLRRPTSPDIDLTTNARPDDIKRLIAGTNPEAVVTVGEQFGTVRVHYRRATSPDEVTPAVPAGHGSGAIPAALVVETSGDVDVVEITTYRSDQYSDGSRKPEVTFGDSLEGDLLRRDFTINAMARDPLSGEIVDPFGGRDDLERGLIRAVGNDAASRFDEDPLRLLRAARFAAQLGFAIEPETMAALALQAPTLARISRERVRDEFTKLLLTDHPARGLRLLVDAGLMPYIVPEVVELCGVSQKPAHSKDVYEHVLRVVERTPARPATRWAGLLHDIAKPRTRSVEDGKVHFFGHEDIGAVMARDILHRLKFDRPFIEYVSRLVKLHMRANAYLPEWTDGAVRRLMLDADDGLHDLLDLSRADITSYRQDKVSRAVMRVNELETRCQRLREEAERVPIRSPLDGNDLMEIFSREPGPWLRPLKDFLLGLVIDGQLAPDDRDEATKLASVFLSEQEQQQQQQPELSRTPAHSGRQIPESTLEARQAAKAARRRQSRQPLQSELQPSGTTASSNSSTQTTPLSRAKEAKGGSQ
jgi:poly(A) polymerase